MSWIECIKALSIGYELERYADIHQYLMLLLAWPPVPEAAWMVECCSAAKLFQDRGKGGRDDDERLDLT